MSYKGTNEEQLNRCEIELEQAETHIAKLEAQLAESCDDMRSEFMRSCPIALKLQKQLAEIEALPEKWRDGALEGLFSGPTAFRECADQLTAIFDKYEE